jgi:hypothetical protein
MKKEALRVTSSIPVAPTTLYFAWIDSEHHASMTGSPATFVPEVGASYSACGARVSGKLLVLDLGRRIILSLRGKDFPKDAPDSRVEVHLEAFGATTRLLLLHTEIPEGLGEKYKALWNEHYIQPMRNYFSKLLPDPRLPPVKRVPLPEVETTADEDERVFAEAPTRKVLPQSEPPESAPSTVKPAVTKPKAKKKTAKKSTLAAPQPKAKKKAAAKNIAKKTAKKPVPAKSSSKPKATSKAKKR